MPDTAIVNLDTLESGFADTARTPEEELMLSEQLNQLYARLRQTLSKREFAVLGLYIDGLAYQQIAARMGISSKAVDNALQRVRRKVGSFDMS